MFLDDHSDFTYVHVLNFQTVDEAVEAKEAFEAYSESNGVDIKYYHSDHGISRGTRWVNHCEDMHQGLNFLDLMLIIKMVEWSGASDNYRTCHIAR